VLPAVPPEELTAPARDVQEAMRNAMHEGSARKDL
jgi:hypothetical protein